MMENAVKSGLNIILARSPTGYSRKKVDFSFVVLTVKVDSHKNRYILNHIQTCMDFTSLW